MSPSISNRAASVRSSAIRDLLARARTPGMLSMAGGLPDPASFPNALLAESARAIFAGGADALQYGPSEGENRLRDHISLIELSRHGHVVDPASILITTGSQQALTMAATVLADPGDVIAVSHPCYLGALQTFALTGLRAHPVLVHDGYLDLDRLEHDLRRGVRVKALYVVANHGNPDGHRIGDAENQRLAAIADHWGIWIVEDDPYRELWFDTPPVLALAAHTQNVISLGSFSKTVAPGLRVGWLAASTVALAALVRTKQSSDLHTSSVSQALIVGLLDRPNWFAEHTEMLRAVYATRRDALCSALTAEFGERIIFERPTGGMFAWARLEGIDTMALLDAAVAGGVCFVPGGEFESGGPSLDDWLRLSFATLNESQLTEAVHRLAQTTSVAAPANCAL